MTKKMCGSKKSNAKAKPPKVFLVHGSETIDGKHAVDYAKNGDLNNGDTKRFTVYQTALKFANAKAKQWGVKAIIDPY